MSGNEVKKRMVQKGKRLAPRAPEGMRRAGFVLYKAPRFLSSFLWSVGQRILLRSDGLGATVCNTLHARRLSLAMAMAMAMAGCDERNGP
jgi:hypothetical protein